MKRLFALAVLGLAACIAEEDVDLDVDAPDMVEQAETMPPCTAANEGATHIVTKKLSHTTEVSTYECQSGTWQLIRRCTGGTCIDY
ncbi:hypothetical protein [Polyangium sp. y55x31]|uniref:hypothetical protein n=1 Tax=Polyangium sp. y55x31 TaxID=3042688 RepID=UPI0024830129|nr:hypothetical protein [Polyangium sp. y55x31]MDI1480114.1 hypothetical protein [Polyangium sp. y55x31]